MQARPEVLDRVRKLLDRTTANGCTEAEAQEALAKAQRLMDEHNLSMAHFERETGQAAGGVEFVAWESDTAHSHYVAAMLVVQEAFPVVAVMHQFKRRTAGGRGKTVKVDITLYGDPANVEAATWALDFLATSFRSLWDRYRVRHRAGTAMMKGYYHGLGDGFLAKLKQSRAELERQLPGSSKALALRAERFREMARDANPGMELQKVGYRDGSAYDQGYKDGQEINLARPVEQGRRAQLPR
jgi:hypothetical protein